MRAKDVLGRYGEEVAAGHLRRRGMSIVERNWRCREGELDIVARDGDVLVFCEVKTRSSTAYGTPAEAVTPQKLHRLRRLAAAWLAERRPPYTAIRFDVVAVLPRPEGPSVEHLEGVS